MNFSGNVPKTTSFITPQLSGINHGHSVAVTEAQSPPSFTYVQHAVQNVQSTSSQQTSPTILPTITSNYQPVTLLASKPDGLNQLPTFHTNTVTTNGHVLYTNDASRSPVAHPHVPPMEISQLNNATIIAKPVPLMTDITLGATPTTAI